MSFLTPSPQYIAKCGGKQQLKTPKKSYKLCILVTEEDTSSFWYSLVNLVFIILTKVKIYYYGICSPLILRWCWSKITSKYKSKTTNIPLLVTDTDSEMPKKICDKISKSPHPTIQHRTAFVICNIYHFLGRSNYM